MIEEQYLAANSLPIHIKLCKVNGLKYFVYSFFSFLTLGFLKLLTIWYPIILIRLISEQVFNINEATVVVVDDNEGNINVIEIYRGVRDIPIFEYKKVRYCYIDGGFITVNNVHVKFKQLSLSIEEKMRIYGYNIIEIEDPGFVRLFVDEILTPFYVFQVFCVIIWCIESYYIYALAIVVISLFSVFTELFQINKNLSRLKELAYNVCPVFVYRDGAWKNLSSTLLVPGDLVSLDNVVDVPCDLALLHGDCIVDESSLTGESVPISKVPLCSEPNLTIEKLKEISNEAECMPNLDKLHCISSGTKILACHSKPTAVVVNTGYRTVKGRIILDILYPRPIEFQFVTDSVKVVKVLSFIAILGMVYTFYVFYINQANVFTLIIACLDLSTVVVPPALPAALTIGTSSAISRLLKRGIYCISPPTINVAGTINVCVFDKTGTLTQDNLSTKGICLIDDNNQLSELKSYPVSHGNCDIDMCLVIASCHSLRIIHGNIIGDPLDLEIFKFTQFGLREDNGKTSVFLNGMEVNIVHRFAFESRLKRMSAIVEVSGKFYLFIKGAPEVLEDLAIQSSIPRNWNEAIRNYTFNGYRIIACGYKQLPLGFEIKSDRGDLERGIDLLGICLFENALKPKTSSVIKVLLNECRFRVLMATGDNILTAISVGRECGMIPPNQEVFFPSFDKDCWNFRLLKEYDQSMPLINIDECFELASDGVGVFAIDGEYFNYIKESADDMLSKLIESTCIFARFSPDDKRKLIEELQDKGLSVLMCGDGANDCGALKAADTGISIADTEASVSAHFTSSIDSIECVPLLINEGRCALDTSFACFKYIIIYSVIQFTSVMLLYSLTSNFGDYQYLFIDMVLVLPLAILMVRTGAARKLTSMVPNVRLFSVKVLASLFGQIALQLCLQLWLFLDVKRRTWYEPPDKDNNMYLHFLVNSYENTVIFRSSCWSYIILAIVYNTRSHYRNTIISNEAFVISLFILLIVCFYVFFGNGQLHYILDLRPIPSLLYEVYMVNCIAIYGLLSFTWEHYVVQKLHQFVSSRLLFRNDSHGYENVEELIELY